ncbi:diguanylate cyclase [Terriglobus roseus]|uniref:diguanylate cyclase n=1 Tax=Terriglobus roseus TaxID=392734 RepID=UPI0012F6ADF2|nr:diguanylate cyclase [Terriglobus roseus]
MAAALGSVVFTVAASSFVYQNTKNLIEAEGWVEHSQEVLNSLQSASQRLDRIEAYTGLYLATKNEDQLIAARSNVVSLSTSSTRIRSLVFDNAVAVQEVTALGACATRLAHDLERVPETGKSPQTNILKCRQTLGRMSEQERTLLKQRTEASRERSQRSVVTEFSMGGISLLALVFLFGFLIRDAFRRKSVAILTNRTNSELATTVQQLHNRAEESRLLTDARDELQLCTGLDQVYRAAVSSFARLAPATSGTICMINNSRAMAEVVARWGLDASMVEIFVPDSCCSLRSGRLRWREIGASEVNCSHFLNDAPETYFCLPLVAQGETLGMLFLTPNDKDSIEGVRSREDSIRQLAELTAMTIAGLQLRVKLENQSVRDGLTGLFNRHFMEIALERELARASRSKSQVAMLMLDVDHFKTFNDQYGHATGDIVLKEVATVFEAKIRSGDMVCRYGGEEFAIILPDVTVEGAFMTAERIRTAIAGMRLTSGLAMHSDLSVSVGVALFPQDAENSGDLLRKADAALYRAKHEGRNQVVLA